MTKRSANLGQPEILIHAGDQRKDSSSGELFEPLPEGLQIVIVESRDDLGSELFLLEKADDAEERSACSSDKDCERTAQNGIGAHPNRIFCERCLENAEEFPGGEGLIFSFLESQGIPRHGAFR